MISFFRFIDKPQPEKCLVFEDAPNGVAAAVSAGMQVVMIPDENVPAELQKSATIRVSSLSDTPLEKFGLPALWALGHDSQINCLFSLISNKKS